AAERRESEHSEAHVPVPRGAAAAPPALSPPPSPARPRPALPLPALGVASLALYILFAAWLPLLPTNVFVPLLDLGKIAHAGWPAALHYAALVAGLFALYGLGYRVVAAGGAGIRPVLAFAAAFALVLLAAYPATAADVFGYVAQGRLLAFHGANPFFVAPSAFPGDPILPYLAFPHEPSQYGPLWALLEAAVARLAAGHLLREVLLYKLVGALAHLASAALVYAVALRLGSDRRRAAAGAYLFAWNPLLLWE